MRREGISQAGLLCGVAAGLVTTAVGYAQDVTTADTDASSVRVAAIENIVVTARKREERLQDVPVAVTAISSEMLTESGTVDIRDVAKIAPGLFYQSFDPAKPNLYIRGIGTRSYDAGAEASVGTFVDGVYIARFGAQVQDLADVERVEVLKGPQGALFGRNTIGGAINIVTKKPRESREIEASLTHGWASEFDGELFNASGRIGGPIVQDRLFAQIAASYSDSDGPVLVTNTGKLANGGGTSTVRGRAVWTPTDRFELDLIGDYFESVDNDLVYRTNDVGGLRPRVYLSAPGLTVPVDPDPYKTTITEGYEGDSSREGWGAAAIATFSMPAMELTSISAYRELDTSEVNDSDGTMLNVVSLSAREASDQFSQEFRLASSPDGSLTFGGTIDWLVGAYYFKESIDRNDNLFVGPDSVLIQFTGDNPYTDRRNSRIDTESFAAFGQLGINLTSQLKLDLGLRYSEEKKEGVLSAVSGGGITIPSSYAARPVGKFDSVDPSATLSYKMNDDVLLYVNYSRGFKGGAFQFLAGNALLANQIVKPEELDAFQLGVKADLFDRRLRANLTGFIYEYDDLQVPRFAVPVGGAIPALFLTNAAKSTIRGAELEGVGLLTDGLRIEYGYAWLDATYDEYVYNAATSLDFKDNRLPRSPEHSLKLAIVYEVPTSTGDVTGRLSMNHLSSFHFEPDNGEVDAGTREPPSTTFDASLSWRTGSYKVTVWARNFTNEEYRVSIVNAPSPFRLEELWAPRRTFGVTLSANW